MAGRVRLSGGPRRPTGRRGADPLSAGAGERSLAAYAWFRAEPLPGFGGATPNLLLREGKADHVHVHLDRVMAGGYA